MFYVAVEINESQILNKQFDGLPAGMLNPLIFVNCGLEGHKIVESLKMCFHTMLDISLISIIEYE